MDTRVVRFITAGLMVGVLLLTSVARADEGPLREARSPNKRYTLRIEPGAGGNDARATATLLNERLESWHGALLNEIAPAQAFVRNDGRFVVTLDDHRRGGAQHALVLYDAEGRPKASLGLRDLLQREDWKHVRVRDREVDWLSDARMRFRGERRESGEFIIRLRWGREIRIDLEKGRPIRMRPADEVGGDSEGGLQADGGIPPEIAALLETIEAIEFADEDDDAAEDIFVEEGARGLVDSFVDFLLTGFDDLYRDEEELSGTRGEDMGSIADPNAQAEILAEADFDELEDAMLAAEEDIGTASFDFPPPNLSEPVDYVALVNERIATRGPSAAPMLDAAAALATKQPEDPVLFGRALDGDPAALQDPVILDWVLSNQAALEMLREATTYEHRGWTLVPSDEEGLMYTALLPSLGTMRNLTAVLAVEAQMRFADGDIDGALENHLLSIRVGEMTGAGVTMIENLVGVAINARTTNIILDTFANPNATSIDYERFANEFEGELGLIRPASEIMQFEKAALFDTMQHLYALDPQTGELGVRPETVAFLRGMSDDPAAPLSVERLQQPGMFESAINNANQHYGRLSEAVTFDYPEAQRRLAELEQFSASPEFRESNPLIHPFLPGLARTHLVRTRGDAGVRATALVARLKAYQQRHGTYPDSLDALGGGNMTIDPFSGQPFRYESSGGDFRLYSVGPDMQDDSGTPLQSEVGDMIYWPRPAK